MNWLNIVLVTYAGLVFAGGVYGYTKAGSAASVIASTVAAIVIGAGIYVSGTNRSVGYGICALVALALAAFFGYRVANGNTMPGIPALAMSIIALACLAYAHWTQV